MKLILRGDQVWRLSIFALVGVLFAGCAGYSSEALGPPVYEIYKKPLEEARSYLADKTILTFAGHGDPCGLPLEPTAFYKPCRQRLSPGAQVEYLAADGTAYLWHPGRGKVIPGFWTLDDGSARRSICFLYPDARTFVDYENIDDEDADDLNYCTSLGAFADSVSEVTAGDPFGLAARQEVPFSLRRQETTVDDLLKQL